MSVIKTLDEILADMGKPVSANVCNTPKPEPALVSPKTTATPPKPKKHPKPKPSAVDLLLNNNSQTVLDDQSLQLLSKVQIEKLDLPDKATRYLRWLAFYYLSRRELSRYELRQKLIAKDCDPHQVDELLTEFADKGYQSDERCAFMLIREAIRKGRGKRHIQDSLNQAHIALPHSLDELIEMAGADSLSDGTVLENADSDGVDWLTLAVEARCKKYGNTIPKDPKEKARQLRFLQYRGFEMDVCFEALKFDIQSLSQR